MNESTSTAPLVKHELVMRRCPNPRAIYFCVATSQALQWLKVCECYFDSLSSFFMRRDTDRLPTTYVVEIPECYDFEEVFRFIADKPFVKST